MNPDTRFAATLVASLVVTAPAFRAALDGERDVVSAGLRYLGVFALIWIAVGVIGRLYNTYVADLEVAREEAEAAEKARRRAEDAQAIMEAMQEKTAGGEDDDTPDTDEPAAPDTGPDTTPDTGPGTGTDAGNPNPMAMEPAPQPEQVS